MLENIFGIGIFWFYLLGLILFLMGIAYVGYAGRKCWHDVKDIVKKGMEKGSGRRCITSIKHLGVYWVLLLFYLFVLFLISIYVIVYGYQNGWGEVYTLDLATAVAYIAILVLVALK